MRVLLVNTNRFKQPWPVIPIGMCCVASTLKKAKHTVSVLDLCFSKTPKQDISDAITDFTPDVVGISIRNIDNASGYHTKFLLDDIRDEIVSPLKLVFKGPIIIGGPAVGISASEMLTFFDLPYAIRGDGEASMIEFLKHIERGASLSGMAGLVEQKNKTIVQDNAPLFVNDLDSLEFSRCWEWIDLKPYRRIGSPLLIQTKRGCNLTCVYCSYNHIEGHTWRLRSPKKIVDEMQEAIEKTGIRQFEITDSTFNIPLEHAKAVLREIRARNLDVQLQVMGINPGAVDGEFVSLLKEAGFTEVDLGVESACNETLKSLGKRFDVETVQRSGKLLHKAGIAVRSWALLLGAPNETPETVIETLKTIRKAADPWDLVDIGIGLRIYKGSPISRRVKSDNPCCNDDHFFRPVTYQPEAIAPDEIKALAKREALKASNLYMYDENQNYPLFFLAATNKLLHMVAPNQPLWRLFIVFRKIEMYTGINFIRRIIHEIKYYKFFSKIRNTVSASSPRPTTAYYPPSSTVGVSKATAKRM
jgi:radical SAM superfamily enzyme YgiQ (UPF0313 family)